MTGDDITVHPYPEKAPVTMSLFSGGLVDPETMVVADLTLVDIVWALSHQCRYNGHCPGFYSVAEHAALVGRLCTTLEPDLRIPPWERVFAGCLHDAAEAYLGDLIRPVKARVGGLWYARQEARILELVGDAFGISAEAWALARRADEDILKAELHHFWPGRFSRHIAVGLPIRFLTPIQAGRYLCETLRAYAPERHLPAITEVERRLAREKSPPPGRSHL